MVAKKSDIIWRWFFFSLSASIFLAIFASQTAIAQGKVITDEIYSPSLEGNLLNDPFIKPINIYLPPSYDIRDTRYPVIYFLHSYQNDEKIWVDRFDIHNTMDDLIKKGKVNEMIIVMPNADNRYAGSWYANSSVAGNYEDYITQDLVDFIDSKYRTLPRRESRAIAGGSMGGLGAMYIAIKHPNLYCAVVSHSGVLSLDRYKSFILLMPNYIGFIAMSIAFSPNPDADLLYDYPADNKGNLRDDVWQRWLEHDPTTLAKTHQENLKQLKSIYFDHGTIDSIVPAGMARDFDQALTATAIPHVYEEYVGTHTDQWQERLRITLPFLSDSLSLDAITLTRPKGKLSATWASLKEGAKR